MTLMVNIDEITPGMKPAANVYDRRGRFLIAKDIPLTEKHIRVLKAWGVAEVSVDAEDSKPADDLGGIDKERLREAEDYFTQKFAKSDLSFEPNQSLYRLCVRRRALADKPPPKIIHPFSPDNAPAISAKPAKENAPNFKLRSLLTDDSESEIKLPSLPAIFYRITHVINNPRSSSKDIADVVSLDTSLSARLLRIVNSAFYGFASKIDTISRAVVLVGAKQIAAMALGIQIINSFKHIPNELINMELFWKHSVSCGIAARTIARYKNIANSERLFIGGLLHDLGRLIIFKFAAEQGRETIYTARREAIFLNEAEYRVLNVRHTDLGKNILKRWKLPINIENMVAYHHTPLSAPSPLEPAIIYLSDIIVNAIEVGSSGEALARPILPLAWDALGLSSSIFPVVVKQVDRQLAEIIRFFFND